MKNLISALVFVILVCTVTTVIAKQVKNRRPAVSNPPAAMMKDLDFLVGEWKGGGWMQTGPTERHELHVEEKVTKKVGGHALLVEGRGTIKIPGNDEPQLVHNALGVIWVDQKTGKLQFESWLGDGRHAVHDAEFTDGEFIWKMTLPDAGVIRYILHLNENGQWHETGERQVDKDAWQRFFEVTLDKVDGGEIDESEPKQ